jgi:lysophospholipase L1-like esterase
MKASSKDGLPKQSLNGATVRQTVRISVGGTSIRLHLSNLFGETPLALRSVNAALQVPKPRKKEGSPITFIPVRFSSKGDVQIPAGSDCFSDEIPMVVAPLADVIVTFTIEHAPQSITSHPGARATSYIVAGDHSQDAQLSGAETIPHWYFLAGIEVLPAPANGVLVAFGDSITDGRGSRTDQNERWSDFLAQKIVPNGIGVANEGIGGNSVLHGGLGPTALIRFDRDALSVSGARFVVLLEGVNDLGGFENHGQQTSEAHEDLVKDLEAAYSQMIERAHARGIVIFGSTLTPFEGSGYYNQRTEQDRKELNRWIRQSGGFDGIIDFERSVCDPSEPSRLKADFDSGDHLHLSPSGYRRMADSIPISMVLVTKP